MNRGNRISVIISKIWKLLIGSRKDFSQTNRTVNVVCVITTLFLIASFIDNLLLGLKEPLMINLICIGLLLVVYGMSRFRKAFKPALALYAMSCYVALAATYIYNGGIDGPALIMFFLTFHLPRTVMTSLTVFLVVLILFVVGGEVTRGFAFAMLIGVLTGTFSSIFVAAPILVDMDKSDKLKNEVDRDAQIEELKKMA